MKLIAYANWHEVEHIRNELVGGYQAIWDVGFQCKKIMQRGNLLGGFLVDKEPVDEIILFGSCGMLQNKKITFHMIFFIGLILCLLAAFYYLSAVNSAIGNEISKIHKYHKDKEREEKDAQKKKGFGF